MVDTVGLVCDPEAIVLHGELWQSLPGAVEDLRDCSTAGVPFRTVGECKTAGLMAAEFDLILLESLSREAA